MRLSKLCNDYRHNIVTLYVPLACCEPSSGSSRGQAGPLATTWEPGVVTETLFPPPAVPLTDCVTLGSYFPCLHLLVNPPMVVPPSVTHGPVVRPG